MGGRDGTARKNHKRFTVYPYQALASDNLGHKTPDVWKRYGRPFPLGQTGCSECYEKLLSSRLLVAL